MGSCILVILLGGWNLHHSRDLRLIAKEIWGEWRFHLQLAHGNNLWTTFFSAILLCSLLAQKENVLAILAVAVESAHPSALAHNTSTWAFCRWFPLSIFIHMIWMSFQMSLRMSFPIYMEYPQNSWSRELGAAVRWIMNQGSPNT